MSIYFPVVSIYFPVVNQKEIDNFDVNSISEDSPDGYILEVDF